MLGNPTSGYRHKQIVNIQRISDMSKTLILLTLLFMIVGCAPSKITVQTEPTINISTEVTPAMQQLLPEPPSTQSIPNTQFQDYYPGEVYFWVNDLLVPQATLYNGSKFIAIRTDQIRTFAGSFGPYYDNPTEHLTIVLCAELTKATAAPACERVESIYRENYVSFAKGYGEGEYIGGRVYKDYTAYYNVFADQTQVAASNKAVVRTVN